jgi:hypothetical protein
VSRGHSPLAFGVRCRQAEQSLLCSTSNANEIESVYILNRSPVEFTEDDEGRRLASTSTVVRAPYVLNSKFCEVSGGFRPRRTKHLRSGVFIKIPAWHKVSCLPCYPLKVASMQQKSLTIWISFGSLHPSLRISISGLRPCQRLGIPDLVIISCTHLKIMEMRHSASQSCLAPILRTLNRELFWTLLFSPLLLNTRFISRAQRVQGHQIDLCQYTTEGQGVILLSSLCRLQCDLFLLRRRSWCDSSTGTVRVWLEGWHCWEVHKYWIVSRCLQLVWHGPGARLTFSPLLCWRRDSQVDVPSYNLKKRSIPNANLESKLDVPIST